MLKWSYKHAFIIILLINVLFSCKNPEINLIGEVKFENTLDISSKYQFQGKFIDIKDGEFIYFAEPTSEKKIKIFLSDGSYVDQILLNNVIDSIFFLFPSCNNSKMDIKGIQESQISSSTSPDKTIEDKKKKDFDIIKSYLENKHNIDIEKENITIIASVSQNGCSTCNKGYANTLLKQSNVGSMLF